MLLYPTKYSRSFIFNDVRESCKSMDGATMGTYLEFLGVNKFLLDTENLCLKIYRNSKIRTEI
jgi:hypothetical protein